MRPLSTRFVVHLGIVHDGSNNFPILNTLIFEWISNSVDYTQQKFCGILHARRSQAASMASSRAEEAPFSNSHESPASPAKAAGGGAVVRRHSPWSSTRHRKAQRHRLESERQLPLCISEDEDLQEERGAVKRSREAGGPTISPAQASSATLPSPTWSCSLLARGGRGNFPPTLGFSSCPHAWSRRWKPQVISSRWVGPPAWS